MMTFDLFLRHYCIGREAYMRVGGLGLGGLDPPESEIPLNQTLPR